MSNVNFLRGTSGNLPSVGGGGSFYLCTDNSRLYYCNETGKSLKLIGQDLDTLTIHNLIKPDSAQVTGTKHICIGQNLIVGAKGYKVNSLSTTPDDSHQNGYAIELGFVNIEEHPSGYIEEWSVGDRVSLQCDNEYVNCATIVQIGAGIVYLSDIPSYYKNNDYPKLDDSGNRIETTFVNDIIYNIDKPFAGDTELTTGIIVNGIDNTALGTATAVFGSKNNGYGSHSFITGMENTSSFCSHVEGRANTTKGRYCHSEGRNTSATGDYAHSEGVNSVASGVASHAEGSGKATGNYSHAEGTGTTSSGLNSHSEGIDSIASGEYSHAEGVRGNAQGSRSHAEGGDNTASGRASHAEGEYTVASGDSSHSEGYKSTAGTSASHAEGVGTITGGSNEYNDSTQLEKLFTGYIASNSAAHAEGAGCIAQGDRSHAEGRVTFAKASDSHAEGVYTIASGYRSHAQGLRTTASANQAHAQGEYSVASGIDSFAGGYDSEAAGYCSFTHGYRTNAKIDYQTVFGKYNADNANALFIIGNGNSSTPKNLFEVTVGDGVKYDGNKLATEDWVKSTNTLVDATKASRAASYTAAASSKFYAVQLDSNNKLGVYVPWTGGISYSAGTGLSLSGTTFAVKTGYTTSGKNYAVKADGSGNLYVNVPWEAGSSTTCDCPTFSYNSSTYTLTITD